MIKATYTVQRQPSCETRCTPAIGPMIEPRFMIDTDIPTAMPRVIGPKTSARIPDPTASPLAASVPISVPILDRRTTKIVATI